MLLFPRFAQSIFHTRTIQLFSIRFGIGPYISYIKKTNNN